MMLGIARGDVAGDTLGESESPEDTKRPGELLLAAESFLPDGVAGGKPGHGRSALFGHSHFVFSCLLSVPSVIVSCMQVSTGLRPRYSTRYRCRRRRGRRLLGS